jgi:8-amino-7-oxononanoate synthase
MTDIAIVGLSCRFRGARNATEFWRLMVDAKHQFQQVPPGRWRRESFYDPAGLRTPHKAYTDQVAFLDEIEAFAPLHYGLPPKRAKAMDPQHRLLVDLAREAIQDAGWERRPFDRARTGVFVGISTSDYRQLTSTRVMSAMLADGSLHHDGGDDELLTAIEGAADAALAPLQAFSLPGCLPNMAPSTVSSVFDLGGPSFALDAACSSTLVAMHQAVMQLRTGSCSAALVGGVFLNLTPDVLVGFSRIGALSRQGVCRPFDKDADGFVLGEGGALLVLRPLADAVADGDRVYAVVRGVGASNDGGGAGPMTPQPSGQAVAMRAAYRDAGIAPGTVGMIEAHGTATTAGDRAELEALRIVRADEPQRLPCALSSTKALIGHTLPAAGAAGLIKAALALHHAAIPPQPITTPSPDLPLAEAGLEVPTELTPWHRPETHGRRAAVSSFGFGGTNVHAVLEEAPARPADAHAGVADAAETPWLLLLSAGTTELLAGHAAAVRDALAADTRITPAEAAYTLATRTPLSARLAVVAATRDEMLTRLAEAATALRGGADGAIAPGVYTGVAPREPQDRRVAFLYPGQGSQRVGMLMDVFARFAQFREPVERLDNVVRELSGTSAIDLLRATDSARPDAEAALTDTRMCQPTLGVLGIGMARLLADCGVRPHAALGHSVGEFAAAVASGAVADEEAVRFLVRRGATIAATGPAGEGAMLAVQATEPVFAGLIDGIDGVWAGCVNHPSQIVASGRREAVARLRKRCAERGVPAAPVQVSHAFHSPLMAAADERTADLVGGLNLRPLERPLISSVDGAPSLDPQHLRGLWARHASSPVLFASAARAAEEAGVTVFVQLYGGTSLLAMARKSMADPARAEFIGLSAAEPDAATTFLTGLGRLAVLGVPVDLLALFDGTAPGLVTLPPSPLATQRYSIRTPDATRPATRQTRPATPTPAQPAAPAPTTITDSTTTVPIPPVDPPSPGGRNMHDLINFLNQQLDLLRTFGTPTDQAAISDLIGAAVPPTGAVTTQPASAEPTTYKPRSSAHAAAVNHNRHRTPVNRPYSSATESRVTDMQPRSGAAPDGAGRPPAQHEDLVAKLLEAISRISSYPTDHLRLEQSFVNDLGFDSIMMTDLAATVQRRWPHLQVDQAVFAGIDSISDLVRIIGGALNVPAPDHQEPATPAPEPTQAAPATLASAEHADVRHFPEVVAVQQRGRLAAQLGVRNPYFLVHEGTIRDRTRVDGKDLISFSSYNYLGLSGDPAINTAVQEAVHRYGSSVSAARILSGERALHVDLDRELAALLGAEAAVTLVSGHATNVSVIGHLVGPDDLIVHDALAHDSILQGCRLSGATRRPFPHNDVAALEALLVQVRDRFRRVLIVVEGVYSMDGDIPDLPALIEVKKRHNALLMIDEAHSIGVLGAHGGGIGEHYGVERTDVDLWAGTLSKSMASCGGYVAGRHELIEYLRYTLPGFIFSAGMTPPNAAAALAALRVMQAEPQRLRRLHDRAELFCRLAREAGIDTGTSAGTPVIPCVTGNSQRALELADALFRRGVSANPILYPAVKERLARLRFFVTADHTPEQIEFAVGVTAEELRRLDSTVVLERA